VWVVGSSVGCGVLVAGGSAGEGEGWGRGVGVDVGAAGMMGVKDRMLGRGGAVGLARPGPLAQETMKESKTSCTISPRNSDRRRGRAATGLIIGAF
jgi:hypothetical protein